MKPLSDKPQDKSKCPLHGREAFMLNRDGTGLIMQSSMVCDCEAASIRANARVTRYALLAYAGKYRGNA